MTTPMPELSASNPLLALLQQHFQTESLQTLLGAEASTLQEHWRKALSQPLEDFLSRPGKEFRAQLVATTYALAGGDGSCPREVSLIIEALHAGSLIIDDIEDGSESRRGQPALHVQHGLPVALNAGNWMYFWALALVEDLELSDSVKWRLSKLLNRTLLLCHYGQGLDITARVSSLRQSEVPAVVSATTNLKTGALMELAGGMAAIVAGASMERVETITKFSGQLGTALQMLDDLSGLISTKRRHKGEEDLRLGRPTWPWSWLALSLSPGEFALFQRAASDLSQHPETAAELADSLKEALKGSGRMHVRRHINTAFRTLSQSLGSGVSLLQLREDIHRLEKGYV